VGLELTVMPLALGVVAPLAGRAVDRFGARPLTVTGMTLTATVLCILGLTHPGHGLFVVELGLVGVGLGLFTPANNAAIMGASPRESSGMASGVLNMTRGMGTAMGLAFTGLVFGLAGGAASSAADIGHGFTAALLFLAALAGVAAVLASLRGAAPADALPTDALPTDALPAETLLPVPTAPVPSDSAPLDRPATVSR
jgi:MFS family permease